MSTESFPDPGDPANIEDFLTATAAFLEATAADEQRILAYASAAEAEEVLVGDSVLTAMRRHGVAHLPPEIDSLADKGHEVQAYTEEQLSTVRRGAGLAGHILELQYGGAIAEVGAIRKLIGETMVFLENPEEIRAWLGVLEDALQPYVNLDEILGPDPEAATRQIVEEYEESRRQDEHRRTAKKKRREVSTALIEKIVEEFGEHDDVVDLKKELVALCIVREDDPAHVLTTRAALLGVFKGGEKIDPTNPNFLSTMQNMVNTIREKMFGLPPIETYLPPDWEPPTNNKNE